MKIQIIKDMKKYNEFHLKADLTSGQLLVVKNALELYSENSPVANDVLCFMKRAAEEGKVVFGEL